MNRPLAQSPFNEEEWAGGVSSNFYTRLRGVARLLTVEQYVFFADGKTPQAVDSWFDGMRLGNLAKSDVSFGALTGAALDGIVTVPFSRRMETLSVRDCDRVIAFVRAYLAQPDLAIETRKRAREREFADVMRDLRRDPLAWAQRRAEETGDEEEERKALAVAAGLRAMGNSASARDAFASKAEGYFAAMAARMVAGLQDPSLAPAPPPASAERATPAYQVAQMYVSFEAWTNEQFQVARTQTRLVGVMAALYRFRWEQNRMPETLAELPVKDDFIRDPFTRKSLIYKRLSDTAFELSSAGPLARAGNDTFIPNSERTPITLPPKPRVSASVPPLP